MRPSDEGVSHDSKRTAPASPPDYAAAKLIRPSGEGAGGSAAACPGSDSDDDLPLGEVMAAQIATRAAFLEKKMIKLTAKIGKSDKRASTEGALVLHQANLAETILKSADIKLEKGRKLPSRSGPGDSGRLLNERARRDESGG